MTPTTRRTVECIRCRHEWVVDLATLGKPDQVIYKGDPAQRRRVETYRLICPNCGTPNMLDEETRG